MNIGSLFVDIGLEGAGSAIRGIGSVTKGLRDASLIANQSLQFMTRFFESGKKIVLESSQMGTSILNNSKTLDIATTQLQKWDYAARLSGANIGEMDNAFKSLQSSILGLREGDAPEYFNMLFSEISKIDPELDTVRFLSGDLEYAMGVIRKVAKNSSADISIINAALSNLGFSEGVSNFLRLSDVNLNGISKDLIISDKNVKNLNEMDKKITEIGQVWKVAFAEASTVFDKSFFTDLRDIIKELAELLKSVVQLMKDSGILKGTKDIAGFVSSETKTLSDLINGRVSVGKVAADTGKASWDLIEPFLTMAKNNSIMGASDLKDFVINVYNQITTQDDPVSIANAATNGTQEAIDRAAKQTSNIRGGR